MPENKKMWYKVAKSEIVIDGPFDGTDHLTYHEDYLDYFIFSAKDQKINKNIGYILFSTPKKNYTELEKIQLEEKSHGIKDLLRTRKLLNNSVVSQSIVAEEYRKKGIGTRLYAAVDEYLQKNNKPKLTFYNYDNLSPMAQKLWDKRLKNTTASANDDYIKSNIYGYWILADGSLLPVQTGSGHIGALKQLGLHTNTDAFRQNMIRLVTENQELWVQFEYLKPNSAQKKTLIDMATNWNFNRFIAEADYLPDERYEYQNHFNFIQLINSIK